MHYSCSCIYIQTQRKHRSSYNMLYLNIVLIFILVLVYLYRTNYYISNKLLIMSVLYQQGRLTGRVFFVRVKNASVPTTRRPRRTGGGRVENGTHTSPTMFLTLSRDSLSSESCPSLSMVLPVLKRFPPGRIRTSNREESKRSRESTNKGLCVPLPSPPPNPRRLHGLSFCALFDTRRHEGLSSLCALQSQRESYDSTRRISPCARLAHTTLPR